MAKKSEKTEDTPVTATPALEMPRFDFSADTIKTDEEMDQKVKDDGFAEYFKPGKHDVVVESVEYTGPAKDTNWGKLKVILKGTGDKTIMDFPLLPMRSKVFKTKDRNGAEKESTFPWRKFVTFAGGLGMEVKASNIETVLKSNFADLSKLKGKSASIVVGYQKGHVDYVGKSAEGDNQYKIVQTDGNPVVDSKTKEVVLFGDRAAALLYAKEQKLPVDEYVQVLSYEKGAAAPQADANW